MLMDIIESNSTLVEQISVELNIVEKILKEANSKEAYEFYERAQVSQLKGEIDEAISYLKKSIELQPSFKNAYIELIALNIQIENYTEALIISNNSLIHNSECSNLFVARGIVKNAMELYQEAIEDFSQAIRIENKTTKSFSEIRYEAYKGRRQAHEALDDDEGVADDFLGEAIEDERRLAEQR